MEIDEELFNVFAELVLSKLSQIEKKLDKLSSNKEDKKVTELLKAGWYKQYMSALPPNPRNEILKKIRETKVEVSTNENSISQKQKQYQKDTTGLIPVSKWNQYYPYPSVKSLRQIIFRKKENGFYKVLRKIGGRLYINVNDYIEWANNNRV